MHCIRIIPHSLCITLKCCSLVIQMSLSSEWKVLPLPAGRTPVQGHVEECTNPRVPVQAVVGMLPGRPKESGFAFSVEDPLFPKEAPKNVPWTPWSINHHLGIPRLPNQRKSWIVSCWLWVRQALKPFWIRYYTRYSRFYVLTACDWDTIHV